MMIDEYRRKVEESGCGCRKCNPPVKIDTRHEHLLKTVLTGKDYWRRRNEKTAYAEKVAEIDKIRNDDVESMGFRLGLLLLESESQ